MSACARPEVHDFCQLRVTGASQYALAQAGVGLTTFVDTPALPVREVMLLATVAPEVPVIGRTVRKEAATVAGKGNQVLGVNGAGTGTRGQTQGRQQDEQGRDTWPSRMEQEGKHGMFLVVSDPLQQRLENNRTLSVLADNLAGFF